MEKQLNAIVPSSPSTPTSTAFVETDANTFKDLVQKLTGFTADTEKLPVTTLPVRVSSKSASQGSENHPTVPRRRPPFKLQERRQHAVRKLEIKLGHTTLRNSPSYRVRSQASRLESPVPSPVTPLGSEPLFYSSSGTVSPTSPAVSEEERAIAEKGFYLHPSPLSTHIGNRSPELLTLFPLSSPSQEKKQD